MVMGRAGLGRLIGFVCVLLVGLPGCDRSKGAEKRSGGYPADAGGAPAACRYFVGERGVPLQDHAPLEVETERAVGWVYVNGSEWGRNGGAYQVACQLKLEGANGGRST